ncbi:MAG: winged helix-turn-helix transcriptional regulator [Rhodospirillaceae bacterium]|nr:winged helix-turn-helix transcriptional regulator [Rhodospirillaceae bacterium]
MADKTGLQTEIKLLCALEQREVVTQPALARRLSISVGMVNALLKRAVHKGLVKAKAAPYKRWAYYLTPEGFQEKSRLVAQYLDTSLAFFCEARQEYRLLFLGGQRMGFRRFVLVGRGEVAEIALLAALEADAELVGILDRETNASRLHGLPVLRSLAEAEGWDAFVISESRHPQEAFDRLRGTIPDEKVLAPPFLRIAREPLDFAPPAVEPLGDDR